MSEGKNISNQLLSSSADSDEDSDDMYGPPLPPHMLKRKHVDDLEDGKCNVVGPSLPPRYSQYERVLHSAGNSDSNEEDCLIGPVPSSTKVDESAYRLKEIEHRLRNADNTKNKGQETMSRESWMLELPEDKANIFGVGSRKFLKRGTHDKGDCSVWTDTPEDRAQKKKECKSETIKEPTPMEIAMKNKDKETSKYVDEHTVKYRQKSLVDMHRSEQKVVKSDKPIERRPFSREEDLCINRFDEAQKATIMKKSKQLNNRFSSGERKFL